MSRKVLHLRLKSVFDSRSLTWPPEQVSRYNIKCLKTDDATTVDLSLDEILLDLYENYSDYKRQKAGVLKSLITSIFNESIDERRKRGSDDISMDLDESNSLNMNIRNRYKMNTTEERNKSNPAQEVDELFIPELNITTRLSDVGGIEKIKEDIEDLVIRPLKYPQLYKHLGVQPTKGVLLHGTPGSGKSKLAEAIAGEVGCPFYRVAATEIITGMSGESENRLRQLFEHAKKNAPSIIFLDELDAITPKRENTTREMEKRIVAQLGLCIDGLYGHFVIVIGATNRQEFVDPMIRRNGRFDREISMGIPNLDARSSILKALSNNIKIFEDVNFEEIAHLTPGFVGADLQAVTREAAINCISRIFANYDINKLTPTDLECLSINRIDFIKAISKVQPSAKREGFATIPDVTWNNIGALSHLRKEMEEHIVFPIKFKNLYKKFGVGISTGILLYGPPGCGKTLLAKAVSNECKANFISVKGPELLNKYVGESERAVRLIFQRAAISAPCVIFFDEVDSLCSVRNSESNQVNERVVNQLLTEMDGIQNREYVYIIAATNRPDIIDPAMLRPGRLEKLLYVPLPDFEGRVDILKKITTNIPLGSGINFELLSNQTDGYSGADLACLVREAGIAAVEEIRNKICGMYNMDNISYKDMAPPADSVLTMAHFDIALEKTKPSVKQYQIDFYKEFNKKC